MVEGKDITLAKKEFELLYLLASRPGRVFLRNEILNQVWGNEVIVGDRTISDRQKQVLIEIYRSFQTEHVDPSAEAG